MEKRVGGLTIALLLKVFNNVLLTKKYRFPDPNTRVTINHVKSMWQQAKVKFKSKFSPNNPDVIPDYLAEIIWNQQLKEHSYFQFWTQLNQMYLFKTCIFWVKSNAFVLILCFAVSLLLTTFNLGTKANNYVLSFVVFYA